MGDYVYKVTSNTVELSNGETASVAVYAYKPTYYTGSGYASNDQMHVRSGAGKCDRYADTRSEWVVLGHLNKDTGKIEVAIEAMAKRVGKRGSFSDGWFDMRDVETSAVAATLDRKVQLVRHEQVMLNDVDGVTINYAYDRKRGWVETGRSTFRTFNPLAA